MRILVGENNETGLRQLTQMLELDGHRVASAETWAGALALCAELRPDLILLNPAFADGDGYAGVADLKRHCGDRFVPVIVACSVSEGPELERFLACEADDFIDLPYDHLVLRAKIAGFERVDELYQRLDRFRAVTEQEIKLARHMFDAVANRRSPAVHAVHHWSLAAGHFCGDLLIFERTPSDRLHAMLGDFTGHGLAAAIGALPTSEIFFAMTRKGFPIGEIAREINRKLHALLPTGQFCAGCLVSIALGSNAVEVWNGGLPPVLLADGAHRVVGRCPSEKLPLGVASDHDFDATTACVHPHEAGHVILYSDGLVEARDAAGRSFGESGLTGALGSGVDTGSVAQRIRRAVTEFLNGRAPHDDISMLAVNLGALS